MTPFDGICQNLQKLIFTIFIFATVRPVLAKVTHRQTDTHAHREMDKAMAIGEIADLPKKQ